MMSSNGDKFKQVGREFSVNRPKIAGDINTSMSAPFPGKSVIVEKWVLRIGNE